MWFKLGVGLACLLVGYTLFKRIFDEKLPLVYDGTYLPEFKPVFDKYKELVTNGKEPGGSFAVYHRGQPLVHVWGGYANLDTRSPWQRDTMTQMFSTTKGLAGIVVAYLVEKGLLDYKRPVGDYWPEFNQNGKDNVTVELLVSHQAGIPVLDTPVSLLEIRDNPDKVERILAEQKPIWPPGTQSGYHALTYGLYVDTLVRKVDPKGRLTAQLFIDEIQKPFGLDVFMNLPPSERHRTAKIHEGSFLKTVFEAVFTTRYRNMFVKIMISSNTLIGRASSVVKEMAFGEEFIFNNHDVREITFSSVMGTGSPAGPAKLYSILAGGGKYEDKVLLKEETIAKLFEPLRNNYCPVTQLGNITFCRGMMEFESPSGEQKLYGHPGYGGQVGVADLENGLGISYLTNHLSLFGLADDPRYLELLDTFYKCFKNFKK